MPKRLVVSPEVLVLGVAPRHQHAVARSLRAILERHGPLPVILGETAHLGEMYVEDDVPQRGRVAVDIVRFGADHR